MVCRALTMLLRDVHPILTTRAGAPYQFGEFQTFPTTLGDSPVALPLSPQNGVSGAYSSPSDSMQSVFQPEADGKRKSQVAGLPTTADLEESSRAAAEEDKRRRNTAASARFRVKKKQREQALEKATKDMTDKVSALEGKVQQLEMENKWLKELITEKGDAKAVEAKLEAKAGGRESSSGTRTDGVGTSDDDDEVEV